MAEQHYPKVSTSSLEEERLDALFYKNTYWYEVAELAKLGLLVKDHLSKQEESVSEPAELLAKLSAMLQEQRELAAKSGISF